MLPDRVSNPGPLTYESGALPIALCGPAFIYKQKLKYTVTDQHRPKPDCVDGAVAVSFS